MILSNSEKTDIINGDVTVSDNILRYNKMDWVKIKVYLDGENEDEKVNNDINKLYELPIIQPILERLSAHELVKLSGTRKDIRNIIKNDPELQKKILLEWIQTNTEYKKITMEELFELENLVLLFKKAIPPELELLTNLKRLDLTGSKSSEFLKMIGNMTNLKHLDLAGNHLQYLPESIGNLVNLEFLTISANELQSLPKEIGNLIKLEHLTLSTNSLSSLPKSIGNLTNLKTLNLSNNKLTRLPKSIGNLVNLEKLYLYMNRLTSLPKSIGNLVNLTNLNLSYNKLTPLGIPKSFGNLVNLMVLSIISNKLDIDQLQQLLPNTQIII